MKKSERVLRLAVLAIAFAGLSACTQIDNALASVPVFAFLREAPSLDPYEMPRMPPPGAIPYEGPQGRVLPPMEASEASLNEFAASEYGRNPYTAVANDSAWVAYGQEMYQRHCFVCHGTEGAGDGPVIGPDVFPMGMSLITGNAPGRSDGYTYGIIRVGRGLMPAYGGRTTDQERWAIVNYVRHLQRAAGAAPAAQPAATATAAATAQPATTDTAVQDTAGLE